MARYIDADALYKNLGFAEKCKDCDHQYNSVFCDSSTWQVVCDAIYEAPTVDAVPVVRCKDCKFSEEFQNDSSGVMARYCNAFRLVRMVADDDYCSYGERKDDD